MNLVEKSRFWEFLDQNDRRWPESLASFSPSGDRLLVLKRMDIKIPPRISMPDVGLTASVEPLSPNYKVVIKYTVEVDGLPVYTETYDVAKLREELERDEVKVQERWFRRITCVIGCRDRRGFSACLTRCLLDGEVGAGTVIEKKRLLPMIRSGEMGLSRD